MAKDYNISKATGLCATCGAPLDPGQPFVATVTDAGEDLQRQDYCPDCWAALADEVRPERLAVWRARVRPPDAKKRNIFVDDGLLVQFFQRLDGADEPAKVRFRFVLALVLMRKKLLIYDRSDKADGEKDVWTMHLKGSDKPCKVTDPHMDEEKIAEVSGQLGQVLDTEF